METSEIDLSTLPPDFVELMIERTKQHGKAFCLAVYGCAVVREMETVEQYGNE